MQETFQLRRFEPRDLEQVMFINRVCLPENYTTYFFMNIHQRFPETFLIAEEEGALVGYIMCRIETGASILKLFRIARKGHVISIAVIPEHQREGIGYALMQKAMKAMVNYGAKECYLEVRTSNVAAIDLYKKMKFKVSRTMRSYYIDGEDAHIMAKRLPAVE